MIHVTEHGKRKSFEEWKGDLRPRRPYVNDAAFLGILYHDEWLTTKQVMEFITNFHSMTLKGVRDRLVRLERVGIIESRLTHNGRHGTHREWRKRA